MWFYSSGDMLSDRKCKKKLQFKTYFIKGKFIPIGSAHANKNYETVVFLDSYNYTSK